MGIMNAPSECDKVAPPVSGAARTLARAAERANPSVIDKENGGAVRATQAHIRYGLGEPDRSGRVACAMSASALHHHAVESRVTVLR